MARSLRIDFAGAWQHLMNRGAGKRTVFPGPSHRRVFLKILEETTQIYDLEVHAYCLMGNHYHLLVRTPNGGISRAMRHLNSVYTQWFNRIGSTDGPLFRGRFRSILVDSDAYLMQVTRYIHLNPVADGLVLLPEHYDPSSYRAYVGLEPSPLWLQTKTVLDLFGESSIARVRYQEFVEAGVDEELLEFYQECRRPPILGTASFRDSVDQTLNGTTPNLEIPDVKRVKPRPDLAAIIRAVCLVFGVEEKHLVHSGYPSRKGHGLARGVVVYLARREGGEPLAEIAAKIGYNSYRGAASALNRVHRAMKSSGEFLKKLEAARRFLQENKT